MSSNPGSVSKSTADLIYDSFYSGAIAGSLVAVFFLVVDAVGGRPLYTPSLLGSVLFEGVPADSVSDVRLEMVVYFSLVHFAVFAAVGTAVSFTLYEVELHARHPMEVLGLLFLIFEGGFFICVTLFLPGVLEQLGAFPVAASNLLAAAGMGLFLLSSHNPELWQRLRHAAHLG
jgi:hypothetical protein